MLRRSAPARSAKGALDGVEVTVRIEAKAQARDAQHDVAGQRDLVVAEAVVDPAVGLRDDRLRRSRRRRATVATARRGSTRPDGLRIDHLTVGFRQTTTSAHRREVELVERSDAADDVDEHRAEERSATGHAAPGRGPRRGGRRSSGAAARVRRAGAQPRGRCVPRVRPGRWRRPVGSAGSRRRRRRRRPTVGSRGAGHRAEGGAGGTTSVRRRARGRRRRSPGGPRPAAP